MGHRHTHHIHIHHKFDQQSDGEQSKAVCVSMKKATAAARWRHDTNAAARFDLGHTYYCIKLSLFAQAAPHCACLPQCHTFPRRRHQPAATAATEEQ